MLYEDQAFIRHYKCERFGEIPHFLINLVPNPGKPYLTLRL
jgi:hypothetical protein